MTTIKKTMEKTKKQWDERINKDILKLKQLERDAFLAKRNVRKHKMKIKSFNILRYENEEYHPNTKVDAVCTRNKKGELLISLPLSIYKKYL